jgi:integrase
MALASIFLSVRAERQDPHTAALTEDYTAGANDSRPIADAIRAFGVAAFTAHDLRRTGRTGLAKLGVKTDIGERVLNHARERIEATYDVHGYIDEKREALVEVGQVSAEPSR